MRNHGKRSTYTQGCRCALCTAAERDYAKAKAVRRASRLTGSAVPPEFAAKHPGPIKAGEVRERIVTTIGGSPSIANIATQAIGAFAGDVVVVEYFEHSILIRRKVDLST